MRVSASTTSAKTDAIVAAVSSGVFCEAGGTGGMWRLQGALSGVRTVQMTAQV
jgi:hypothetical protein